MEKKPLLRSSPCTENYGSALRDSPFHRDFPHSCSADELPTNPKEARSRSTGAASPASPNPTTYGTLIHNNRQAIPSPVSASSPLGASPSSSSNLTQSQEKPDDQLNHTDGGYRGVFDDDKGGCCSPAGEDGEADVASCESRKPAGVVGGAIGPKEQRKRLFLLTLLAFLLSCASMIYDPLMDQYVYQVYSRQVFGNVSGGVHVNKQPCVNSTNSSVNAAKTAQVQEKSGDFQSRLMLLDGGIAIAVNIFLGSYSDMLGRKLLLFLPMFGHFLRNCAAPTIIYFNLGLTWMYVGYILDGLCGGFSAILVGLYAYTADISEKGSQRTVSVTLVAVSIGMAQCLLGILAGLFILKAGFFIPALTSTALLLVCIFLICLLPETVTRDRKSCISPLKALQRLIGTFFPRDERLRCAMLLLGLLGFFMTNLPDMGGDSLDALYLMKEPFCWNSLQQGILTTAKDTSGYLATFTVIRLLAKAICDPLLAVLGLLSEVAKSVVMALARDDLTMYMVVLAGLLRRAIYPPIRAFLSSLVPRDRQGALFAGIAVVESVGEFIGKTCSIGVYDATEHIMHGFVYLVVALWHFISACLFMICWRLFRKFKASQVTVLDVQADKERHHPPPAESPVT